MMTRFRALGARDTLRTAVEELLAGAQRDFPVVDGDRLSGILLRTVLVKAVKERGRDTLLGEVMQRDCAVVGVDEPLHQALTRMRAAKCSTLPVVHYGVLVGLLTLENVGELLMVSTAARGGSVRSKLAEIFASE